MQLADRGARYIIRAPRTINLTSRKLMMWRIVIVVALLLVEDGGGSVIARQSYGWDPPSMTSPLTIWLEPGPTHTILDPNTDYIIHLPDETKLGHTMLEGGRNILIQGGHVTVPDWGQDDIERRGIYIKNATGTVHIQDLLIDGYENHAFDAIAISAPMATVQIVNVRVENVSGNFEGFHGDVVQPFGGVAELRIDGLSGMSGYQGLFLAEPFGYTGKISLRNIDLSYLPNQFDATTFMLWLPVDRRSCEVLFPVDLWNVYITPRPGQTVERYSVWPNSARPEGCMAVRDGDEISWPALAGISGYVTEGEPPGGSFVPQGSVGVPKQEADPSEHVHPVHGPYRHEEDLTTGIYRLIDSKTGNSSVVHRESDRFFRKKRLRPLLAQVSGVGKAQRIGA